MTNKDRAKLTINVIAALAIFLIAGVLVWIMFQYGRPTPLAEDRTALRTKNLADLRAADAQTLNNYAWRDQAKGFVRIPIQDAMGIAVREWQDPAAARSNLIARVEAATAPPPKAPEAPNPYE